MTKRTRNLLVLAVVLLVGVGGLITLYATGGLTTGLTGTAAQGETGYTITFNGVTYNTNGTSTWSYTVSPNNPPHALSHWRLNLCKGVHTVVSATPSPYTVGQDPTTGTDYAIKWDQGQEKNQSRTYTFTLNGWYEQGNVSAATKASTVYKAITVPGPTCQTRQVSPTPTNTTVTQPTPTPTRTPVPPTNTPTRTPPPLTATPTNTPAGPICDRLPGAIFTTNQAGNRVNQNIYATKEEVYLQGGPDQQGAHVPDGTYYYKVTDPSGQTNLFAAPGYRTVTVANGVFPSTRLAPYADTPNPGGEYKVWLSQVPNFDNKCTKTDNFKVRQPDTPTPTNTPPANTPTPTNTPPANTATPTNTPPANTATPTNTPLPSTATPTNTPPPSTATPTNTPPPSTATPTNTPTRTPTRTATPPSKVVECVRCNDVIIFHTNRDGNWEIYRKAGPQANAAEVNLTNNRANDLDPSYAPGSDLIAFQSDRDGNWEIYRLKSDGTGLLRLTNNNASDTNPIWAPICGATKIAFQSNRDGNWEIYVMDADGKNQKRVTNHVATDINPFWSNDGKEIVFQSNRAITGTGSANWNIWVVKPDGSGLRRLTDGQADGADYVDPVWSPDGQWITFRSKLTSSNTWDVYRIKPDGSNKQNLTNGNADAKAQVWSPNSERIAFQGKLGDTWHVFWMNADGSELTQVTLNPPAQGQADLTGDTAYQGEAPAWACDAVSLVFHSAQAGNAELYFAQPGATAYQFRRLTTNQAEDSYTLWSPLSDSTDRAPVAQAISGLAGTAAGDMTTILLLLVVAVLLVSGGWLFLKRQPKRYGR